MSLADLRAQSSASGASTANGQESAVKGDMTAKDPAPAPAEEPRGVAQVVTPSGLGIYYQAAPKRLYRICDGLDPTGQTVEQWNEVPSVSTILEVLEKGGLSWWGMKVGVAGLLELAHEYDGFTDLDTMTVDGVIDLLNHHKLTVNHVKGQAADRGTNVHKALEGFAETGVVPDPQFFPESERGYVEGLVAFINDANPNTLHSELMVASTDGWAGRFDLVANLDFAGKVVTKTFPKKKPVREQISGAWIIDLKTSKGVYPSYKLQVSAYRTGFEECGYGTVDHAGVVRVTNDGRYELVESQATYEDFLTVLDTYRAIKRLS